MGNSYWNGLNGHPDQSLTYFPKYLSMDLCFTFNHLEIPFVNCHFLQINYRLSLLGDTITQLIKYLYIQFFFILIDLKNLLTWPPVKGFWWTLPQSSLQSLEFMTKTRFAPLRDYASDAERTCGREIFSTVIYGISNYDTSRKLMTFSIWLMEQKMFHFDHIISVCDEPARSG